MTKLRFSVLAALTLPLMLSAGCSTVSSGVSSFSGGASMRIEVDVYKGPLSQNYFDQFGAISGLLESLGEIMGNIQVDAATLSPVKTPAASVVTSSRSGDPESCVSQSQNVESADAGYLLAIQHQACDFKTSSARLLAYVETRGDVVRLAKVCGPGAKSPGANSSEVNCDSYREFIVGLGSLVARMKAAEQFWAAKRIHGAPLDGKVGVTLTGFRLALAEFSNELKANSDALVRRQIAFDAFREKFAGELNDAKADLKACEADPEQAKDNGCAANQTRVDILELRGPREKISDYNAATLSTSTQPTSVFIRDTKAARADRVFAWEAAGYEDDNSAGVLAIRNRTRAYEQLLEDHYWTNVNTVFASGRGDVNMAFIKDNVGNWNLKSFENDPGALLEAYQNLLEASVNGVANLLENTTSLSPAVLGQLAALAGGKLAPETESQTGRTIDIDQLDQLDRRLNTLLDQYAARAKAIDGEEGSNAEDKKAKRAKLKSDIERTMRAHARLLGRIQTGFNGSETTGEPVAPVTADVTPIRGEEPVVEQGQEPNEDQQPQ
ncbi:MAG: hypothetical protein ACPGUC_01550 [Gammaproteobacteria bacterium]